MSAQRERVNLTVNGQAVVAEAGQLTLLRFLREELRLTGAKDGTSASAHAGARPL